MTGERGKAMSGGAVQGGVASNPAEDATGAMTVDPAAEHGRRIRAFRERMRVEHPQLYTHPRQPWPWRDPLPEPDAPSRPPRVATDRVSLCPSTILERAEGLVARGLFREARDYLTGRHPVAEVVRSLGHPGWTARLERCLARLDGAATG